MPFSIHGFRWKSLSGAPASRRQDELPNLLAFLGFPNPDPQKCRELAAAWQHMAAPGGSLPGDRDTRRESRYPKRNRRYQTSHPKYKHRGIFGYWGVFSIRVQSVLSIVKSNPCQNRSSPHLNPYNILPTIIGFRSFPPAR